MLDRVRNYIPAVYAMCLTLLGCVSTQVSQTVAIGALPLCSKHATLGDISVRIVPRWRSDQKEPRAREAMARRVVERVFKNIGCGQLTHVTVEPSDETEGNAEPRPQGTVIEIILRELGPLLELSVPILWTSMTDIDFSLHVKRAGNSTPVLSLEHHRNNGGPFAIRSMGSVEKDFERALHGLTSP